MNRFLYPDQRLHRKWSANILDSLDRLNIPHVLMPQSHQPLQVEVTQCFDEASEDGNLLLDFLTHAVKFRETAPEDLKRRVLECYGSSDISEKKEGTVFVSDNSDTFIINKQAEKHGIPHAE